MNLSEEPNFLEYAGVPLPTPYKQSKTEISMVWGVATQRILKSLAFWKGSFYSGIVVHNYMFRMKKQQD